MLGKTSSRAGFKPLPKTLLSKAPQSAPHAFCYLLRSSPRRLRETGILKPFKAFGRAGSFSLSSWISLEHLRHRSQREGFPRLKECARERFSLLLEARTATASSRGAPRSMSSEQRRETHERLLQSQVLPPDLKASLVVDLGAELTRSSTALLRRRSGRTTA